jgi:hypothetical protein
MAHNLVHLVLDLDPPVLLDETLLEWEVDLDLPIQTYPSMPNTMIKMVNLVMVTIIPMVVPTTHSKIIKVSVLEIVKIDHKIISLSDSMHQKMRRMGMGRKVDLIHLLHEH